MVQQWKIKKVDEVAQKIDSAKTVGMLDLSSLGASQLQNMRKDTRDKATIIVTKKSIITRAIEKSTKKNIKDLEKFNAHIPALIISEDNPFKLTKKLEQSKSPIYAKAGQIAPKDIVVPAGDTNLPPGPAISDLQKAGLKAMIQGSKIAIREDCVLAKEGEEITEIKANVLMKLDIKPMEAGLNLLGAHENDMVFTHDILAVDTEQYLAQIGLAYTQGYNLAYNANIYCKPIMEQKIIEAHRNAINLGVNAEIESPAVIEMIAAKANAEMLSVASQLPEDARGSAQVSAASAPEAQSTEAPKAEEKKEEPKEEDAAAGLGALFG